jgi:hypothetical protein
MKIAGMWYSDVAREYELGGKPAKEQRRWLISLKNFIGDFLPDVAEFAAWQRRWL